MPNIIDSVELRDRSGGIRLNGTTIEYVERRQYLIDAGTKTITRAEVLTTTGLPIVGISVLDNNSGAVCSGIEASTVPQNPQYWRVIADFSTQASDQKAPSDPPPGSPPNTVPPSNPTSWIPVHRTSYEKIDFETVVDFSTNKKKLVNSAGTPFAGSITSSRPVTTFSFSQYEPDTLSEKDVSDRNERMNSSDFKGFRKYSLLLSVVGSERGWFNGYRCRKIEYVLKYYEGVDKDTFKIWNGTTWVASTLKSGWRFLVKDVGPEYLDAGVKKKYTINGSQAEANLDGTGAVVSAAGEPAILAFENYPSTDFNSFLRI